MRNRPDRQPKHPKPPFVGLGGKVEERVEEAQDPWLIIEEEAKKLREEKGSGFTYLSGALYEEFIWRTRLRKFGIDGQDATRLRDIPGMRKAQTDEERSEQNLAHGRLLIWQTVANAGWMVLVGEWTLAQMVAGFCQRPASDMYDWLPGPPELSLKLFDVLHRVWLEATAEVLGYVMQQWGDEQATYLLAGLLRNRIKTDGTWEDLRKLRSSLSLLAAEENLEGSPPEQRNEWLHQIRTQLLHELPGGTYIAWSEGGPEGGISALRNRAVKAIREMRETKNEADWREKDHRVDASENQEMSLQVPGPLEDFATREMVQERSAVLEEAILNLSPQQRDIVNLVKNEEDLLKKNGDIAAEDVTAKLGVSVNQVSVQWRRARKALLKAIGE